MKKKSRNRKKEKSLTVRANISPKNRSIDYPEHYNVAGRGSRIYNLSDIYNLQGQEKHGNIISVPTDNPYFALSAQERNQIFQLSSPVFGVVSSRMNRIAGLEFEIVPEKDIEDEEAEKFKNAYDVIQEFQGLTDMKALITVARLTQFLHQNLLTLRPDLSNFQKALFRWKKRIQSTHRQDADEIKEWVLHPNQSETWVDFVKQWVYDLNIHGTSAVYKSFLENKLHSIQHLPGGTVFPARTPYVSAFEAYIQVLDLRYQVFFEDELSYSQYMPVSWRSYSLIPLEALINKISEGLLFDRLMAEQADGTRPPNKALIITESQKFGDDFDLNLPIEKGEQKRIEEKINQPIKNGIFTFSGNSAEVIDLTRENTMDIQNSRQKDIREEVALVFNMSNVEINLTGSDSVSGRETSEIQTEIEQGKGVAPLIKTIEQKMNYEILPFRGAAGFKFKFQIQNTEEKQIDLLTKKRNSGVYSVNEIRVEDLNKMPFDEEKWNTPFIGTQSGFKNNEEDIVELLENRGK